MSPREITGEITGEVKGVVPRRAGGPFAALEDRGPLRVLFAITSMPVGGAETLLVNMIRRFDPRRLQAEVCCLKEPGPLGEVLAGEIPVHSRLLSHKLDPRVLPRLCRLILQRKIDAVITIGAGDKMFWGRLAGWCCGTPVIGAALHSTGWPDVIGRLNRLLTPITDAFIGVAAAHGKYLTEQERFPADKVHVIPNGIDTQRFRPREDLRRGTRAALGIDDNSPVCGVVAALRPEKNLELFLQSAKLVLEQIPLARFLIIGDGPRLSPLRALSHELALEHAVQFLGARQDIPELLNAMDVFSLTSHMEANPVSILEALSCETPVVATDVGSVRQSVVEGETGLLAPAGDASALATHWLSLLRDSAWRRKLGSAGRQLVCQHASLDAMVRGYEDLICGIYQRKMSAPALAKTPPKQQATPAVASAEKVHAAARCQK